MSYDIWMTEPCGHEAFSDINYTYNVAPMWHMAFAGVLEKCDDGIRWLNGKTGKEAHDVLDEVRLWMLRHQIQLEALNPTNGWGDYQGALKVIRDLKQWAKDCPNGVFTVH